MERKEGTAGQMEGNSGIHNFFSLQVMSGPHRQKPYRSMHVRVRGQRRLHARAAYARRWAGGAGLRSAARAGLGQREVKVGVGLVLAVGQKYVYIHIYTSTRAFTWLCTSCL
jgi:hypothetical protein